MKTRFPRPDLTARHYGKKWPGGHPQYQARSSMPGLVCPAAVAVSVQEVGRQSGAQRKPVGGEPVGQRGQDRVTAVDAGQDQQAGQAGLDQAEPARGDRHELNDVGGRVGQQYQGVPGMGAGGAQGG
jgi:hypothetical protein